MNSYMMALARENPALIVNGCSPGFVETALTIPFAQAQGKTPQEMGMISPVQAAKTFDFLMFSPESKTGWYYGSDAKRFPLHKYRSPGDVPFDGDLSDLNQ